MNQLIIQILEQDGTCAFSIRRGKMLREISFRKRHSSALSEIKQELEIFEETAGIILMPKERPRISFFRRFLSKAAL